MYIIINFRSTTLLRSYASLLDLSTRSASFLNLSSRSFFDYSSSNQLRINLHDH